MAVTLKAVPIEKPEDVNLILGQAHFIKTVEDLHEALVTAVPGIRFGLAFCEASGPCLVRWSGTDEALVAAARTNASAIGAGHSFLVLLKGCFPINVLPARSPGTGSLYDCLCDGKRCGGDCGRNGTRPRYSGCCGWGESEGRGRRSRDRRPQGPASAVRLQIVMTQRRQARRRTLTRKERQDADLL